MPRAFIYPDAGFCCRWPNRKLRLDGCSQPSTKHRGGGWAAPALGCRFALGAAASTLNITRLTGRRSVGLFFFRAALFTTLLASIATAPAQVALVHKVGQDLDASLLLRRFFVDETR
jgi:hypothetical protein